MYLGLDVVNFEHVGVVDSDSLRDVLELQLRDLLLDFADEVLLVALVGVDRALR
jgi:hypothetical protein